MSKVFIAWSGNLELAKKLRGKIGEMPGYQALVGGNLHELNSNFVGGTIIEQMKQCDQAILLIQKNKQTNALSANTMFEWGYLLAKLKADRVHNYFIDLQPNDAAVPSDLHGLWSHTVTTEGKTEEQIADELCGQFFASQRELRSNKMSLIMNRAETLENVRKHNADPVCSNYEMAQYLIALMYSANIYLDTRDETLACLQDFQRNLSENARQSKELVLSLKIALNSLLLFKRVQFSKDEQYILLSDFYELRDEYEDILEYLQELKESELKNLLIAFGYDFLSYLYLLIINGNELEPDEKAEYCVKLYEHSQKTVDYCASLDKYALTENKQLCELLRSYMYRNMYCALQCLEELEEGGLPRTESKEERLEKIRYCLKNSLEQRKQLYFGYNGGTTSTTFLNNLEMEYYLALAEYRLYDTDPVTRSEAKRKLRRYVEKAERIAADKRVFTEKIKKYIAD